MLQPLEVRSLRVVLRHRGQYKSYIKVDTNSVPFLQCTYSDKYMVPGLPRTIDVTARFSDIGEYVGELKVYSKCKQDHIQYVNVVPIYAMVQMPDYTKAVPRSKRSFGPVAVKTAPLRSSPRPGSAASCMMLSRPGSAVSAASRCSGTDVSHSTSAIDPRGISRPVSAMEASRMRPGSALLGRERGVSAGQGQGPLHTVAEATSPRPSSAHAAL